MCRKSIIKSIRPEHVANIFNGKKTIEVSTTAPKEWVDYLNGKTRTRPEPREVLIYCTKGDKNHCLEYADNPNPNGNGGWFITSGYPYGNGKVLGKFTLIEVDKIQCYWRNKIGHYYMTDYFKEDILLKCSRLSWSELDNYLQQRTGYAWYIDKLVVFDEPKELRDVIYKPASEKRLKEIRERNEIYGTHECALVGSMLRAPQSWCYCLYIDRKEEED